RSIEELRRRNSDFSWLDNQIFGLDPGALALDLEAELNAAGTKAVLEGILEQADAGNINLTDQKRREVEERLKDPASEESYKFANEAIAQLERDRRGNLAEYLQQRRDTKQAEADAVAGQQAKDREEEKKALEAIAQTQLTVDQANQQYEAGQISFVQYEAALKRELANFDRQANLSPEQQDQRAKILKTLADATNQNVLSGQKLLQQISSLSGEDTFES